MPQPVPEQLSRTVETLYRSESGRVLATLVRLLGDLDLAEEAMHEAFAAALEFWAQTGIPDKPRPWLISTARFKAIDGMRRRARFNGTQRDFAQGERKLSFRRQSRMAAGEDQTEAIIFDLLVIEGGFVDARFHVQCEISLGRVEARAAAHPIDGLETCRIEISQGRGLSGIPL